ncbi:MAG: tRNA (adenosine(37)-N6)-threonylcarbamoyltransferase complex ATPase subunit type 1 TsaE [Bacilli bacterium]|nr:tRNA (adenosine(37)-N6)-threonylcarbamoyltransferase complex ATPase subunit type 1 TsaE [Bacilli bacterium]MDY6393040.1 tRNA (adenosine(37)-N6)-threonylcarbamoyltransferase complex ATPase subunit type 1 TsaE [Bacilli bacterium]
MERILFTHSKEATKALGKQIASFLKVGDVVLLTGDLGAGKTTLTSGVGEGLGVNEEVLSPTFNLLKCYFHGRIPFYHIDAYRLEGQNIEIGLDEVIEGDGACFIEWPQFIEPLIPDEKLEIEITNMGENDRRFRFFFEMGDYGWIESLKEEEAA